MSLKISHLESRLSELIQIFALERQKDQEMMDGFGRGDTHGFRG